MPNHEPANGPPSQPEGRREDAAPAPDAVPAETGPSSEASPPPPRDLAQRVWGSWPSLPTGAAPAAAPPVAPTGPAAVGPVPADVDFEEEPLDADLFRLEDRLRDTEDRLSSFAASTQQALQSLGETIRASTADLPTVIEGVVERQLSAVGDALLKLADLRARIQEETGEAVKALAASFQALEERLAETTQHQVQASIERLAAEFRTVRDEIATGRGTDAIEQQLRERVAELPTRGDFASIRGAIGTATSSLRSELAEAVRRIASIEEALGSIGTAALRPAEDTEPAPPEPEPPAPQPQSEATGIDDPFGGRPLFGEQER